MWVAASSFLIPRANELKPAWQFPRTTIRHLARIRPRQVGAWPAGRGRDASWPVHPGGIVLDRFLDPTALLVDNGGSTPIHSCFTRFRREQRQSLRCVSVQHPRWISNTNGILAPPVQERNPRKRGSVLKVEIAYTKGPIRSCFKRGKTLRDRLHIHD